MRSIRSAVGVIPRKEKLLKESGCSPVVSLWCWFSTSLDGIIFSYLSLGVVFIATCCYLFGSALFFSFFFFFPFFFPIKMRRSAVTRSNTKVCVWSSSQKNMLSSH